jgi:hypothetical protein
MTPWRTAPAGEIRGKVDRELPVAKRHDLCHQLRQHAAVHRVAEVAVPPPVVLIDVQIMEIAVPVPEPGGKGGVRELQQVSLVAGKTELIAVKPIIDESALRMVTDQELSPLGAMRIMASRAESLPDGAVQIDDSFLDHIPVAPKTKVAFTPRQKFPVWFAMGTVTGKTISLRNRGMGAGLPADPLMAGKARFVRRQPEGTFAVLGMCGAGRPMTALAARFRRVEGLFGQLAMAGAGKAVQAPCPDATLVQQNKEQQSAEKEASADQSQFLPSNSRSSPNILASRPGYKAESSLQYLFWPSTYVVHALSLPPLDHPAPHPFP